MFFLINEVERIVNDVGFGVFVIKIVQLIDGMVIVLYEEFLKSYKENKVEYILDFVMLICIFFEIVEDVVKSDCISDIEICEII